MIKESHVKTFDIYKQFNPSNRLYLLLINISKEQFLDKLLILIGVVVEYTFGIYIGNTIGWLVGLYVGQSYVEHFGPVYLNDFNQLSYWRLAPYILARNVAVIGMVVGLIAIAVVNNKPLKKRITS